MSEQDEKFYDLELMDDEMLLDVLEQPLYDPNDPMYQEQLNSVLTSSIRAKDLDVKTGAPFSVRAAVNAAAREEDRFATLLGYYPDAMRVEDFDPENGVSKYGAGNFVFVNPETGKETLFDETEGYLFGATLTDLTADIGPEIAEFGGSLVGMGAGAYAGLFTALPTYGTVNPVTLGRVGEGLGAATSREIYQQILHHFGETEDTRTIGQVASDYTTTAVVNGVSSPIVEKVLHGGRIASGKARVALHTLGEDAKAVYRRLTSVVSEPTAGLQTANPVINIIEGVLKDIPQSSRTMRESAKRSLVELERKALEIIEGFGGARTQQQASEKLFQKGTGEGAEKIGTPGSIRNAIMRYENEVSNLYAKVDAALPSTKMVDAPNTAKLAEELMITSRSAIGNRQSEYGLSLTEGILKDLENGVLDFQQLRNLRTMLMANTRNSMADASTNNFQKTQAKRVIAAITRDLNAHVDSFGDDAIKTIYKEANDYVAKNMQPDAAIPMFKKMIERVKAEVDPGIEQLIRGTKAGDATIRKLKEKLTPEEFEIIPGYILGKMGMPTPGVSEGVEGGLKQGAEIITSKGFNPATFLKNWESYSPEAKEALFYSTPALKEMSDELDNLVFTINRLKQTTGKGFDNPSGTSRALYTMGFLSPFGGYGGSMALGGGFEESFQYGMGAMLAPYASAKLMTSPKFVKWLAGATEIAATDPKSMGEHVRRLVTIGLNDAYIRDEVSAVLEQLQGETLEPTDRQISKSLRMDSRPMNEKTFRERVPMNIADDLIGPAPNQELSAQLDNFIVPNIEGPAFEDTSLSPTVLPNPDDRDIAARRKV